MIYSEIRRLTAQQLSGRLLIAPVLIAATILAFGCASQSRATFMCDRQVNGGNVLTIDLIEVADEEIREIQSAGYDWFYSDLRRQLGHRIKTITVEGSCNRTIDLTKLTIKEKVLRKKKGYGTLAIIAEFRERRDGYQLFINRSEWKGKSIVLRVHDGFLVRER
jgi:hypothetical protein